MWKKEVEASFGMQILHQDSTFRLGGALSFKAVTGETLHFVPAKISRSARNRYLELQDVLTAFILPNIHSCGDA